MPAPIGGLTSGYVYYVRNATANTFQLSATPTGSIISLNVDSPADIKGEHSFHQAGIQFNSSSSGTQDLYIDFTTIRPATTSFWARAACRCGPSRRRRATAFPRRRPTAAKGASWRPASPSARRT